MYQTAHKIIISLLILAQAIVLWQGVFAVGLISDTVDFEQTNCHQTASSEQKLKYDDSCCGDDCQCNNCICSGVGLIPFYAAMSFSIGILNHISFPLFLDWQPVLPFKPPRQFRR